MTSIKGCGVAIIEKYKGVYSVFVIHDKNRGTWEIPGGSKEPNHKTPLYTAHREIREETCGMFNISPEIISTFTFYDKMPAKLDDMIYRTYITCVDNSIKTKVYHHNRKILKKLKNIPSHYMETNDITRINLSQFRKDYENNNKSGENLTTQDYKGREITVFKRDKIAIYHAATNIGNISSIRLKTSKSFESDDPFFNGLYCYWL